MIDPITQYILNERSNLERRIETVKRKLDIETKKLNKMYEILSKMRQQIKKICKHPGDHEAREGESSQCKALMKKANNFSLKGGDQRDKVEDLEWELKNLEEKLKRKKQ